MKRISLFKIDKLLVIAIALSVVGTIFNLILPLVVQQFIDLKVKVNLSLKQVYPIAIILMGGSMISAISTYLISYSGDKRIKNIREALESKILNLPYSTYKNISSGELVSRLTNDALIIKEFTTNEVPNAIISIITLIGGIIILLCLDIKLTLVIIFSFAIVSLIAYPLGKINEKYSMLIQNHLGKLSQIISENVKNIQIIKLYNAQNAVRNKFNNENEKVYSLSKRIDKVFSITEPVQTAVTLLAFLIIILYGSSRVANNTLSFGVMTSFMIYIFEIITPINTLANFYVSYSEAKGASRVISSIMNMPEEDLSGTNLKAITKKIEMKNITFGYLSGKSNVLSKVSLVFEPTKKIALVGPSGAGKTTLINILTRLQDDYEGEITIENKNCKTFSLKSWRSLFSVVTQENNIFSGSIKENLVFGLPHNPSNRELQEALSVAAMENDVKGMKNGLNFEVGENGNNLSGGQKQKIQIARAYLRNTPFIIFDEATSNLDPESETEILRSLDKLSTQKTLIVIAHRLSTIINADKIYFLDNHKILGVGRHDELLRTVPKYKIFVEDQFISKG
ncbi:ABC transporter ATP-binding protein [Lactobacillus crispatus]|uniref:ABC transporter ATP-binding protein n=1 Tax=Lactobacillus crispatus TaxID=47770 RepID=UPI0022E30605|nr:ABC transporter ATP-binding protein [Lactobacillus crispatus]